MRQDLIAKFLQNFDIFRGRIVDGSIVVPFDELRSLFPEVDRHIIEATAAELSGMGPWMRKSDIEALQALWQLAHAAYL